MQTDIPNFPFYTCRRDEDDGELRSATAHISPSNCVTVKPNRNSIAEEKYNSSKVNTSEFDYYRSGESTLIDRVEYDKYFERTLKNIVNVLEP